jgi:ASC-1-like (ASCH) protein
MRKHCQEPYISWIESGLKKYEGRLNKGDWQQVQVGDQIVFYTQEKEVTTLVTSVHHYPSFKHAYFYHGRHLVPEGGPDQYHRFYSQEAIEEYRVVVLGLQV